MNIRKFRMLAALLCVAVFVCGFSVTAYAKAEDYPEETAPVIGDPAEAQRSGFGGERRSSGMSELSPQAEASDMELATTSGCYMLDKCWTGAYCRYFREAVLPNNPVLEAALLSSGPAPDTKACPVCGGDFLPDGRTRYCSPACAKAARRKKQRGYMRKYRG